MFLCKDCNVYSAHLSELKRHCSEEHGTPSDSTEGIIIPIRPLDSATTLSTESVQAASTEKRKRGRPRKYPETQKVQTEAEDGDKKPQRKRGRPRKSVEEKEHERRQLLKRLEEEEQMKHEVHRCQSCGKVFARLRQLSSHRCLDNIRDLNTGGDEEDAVPQTTSIDNPIGTVEGTVEPQSLHFDLESIPDGLDLAGLEMPQILSDEAIPDLQVDKSGSFKVYPCQICKKVLRTKSSLLVHLGMHSSKKRFRCTECSYSSMYKSNLTVHMKKHFANLRLQCDICSYSCLGKSRLKAHRKKHGGKYKPIRCDLCNCRQYTMTKLLHHLETEHNVDTDERAKSYYEEQRMQGQMRQGIYQCHICDCRFKDRENRDAHVVLHKPHKPLQCTMCPYTAYRYNAIETHTKRHWFIYSCHLCKTNVLSLELLKGHLASHEMPAGMSVSGFLEQSINTSMYQSDPIDKELINEHQRKAAITREASAIPNQARADTFHESEGIDVDNGQDAKYDSDYLEILNTPIIDKSELENFGKAFTNLCFKRLSSKLLGEIHALFGDNECPICGRLFTYRPHLATHKKTHRDQKDFKCESCSYSSHTKQGLQRHTDTVHASTNLKCPVCHLETRSGAYLASHMKKHQGSQPFRCTHCDVSADNEAEMKHHIVTTHPELTRTELEKIMGRHIHIRNKMGRIASHRCQHCGRVFRRLCDLRQHLWLHKGITPYKCKLCPFETRKMSNLKSHMVRHSDAKNHLCDACGKMFKMKSALKVHRLAQHPNNKQPQTFRCYQCTQFTSDQKSLREHYRLEHPDTFFDETLNYEVPEDRITILNISINQKDGCLHYRCSQCDVHLVNNGELGQHLRETHGLAITTSTEADGVVTEHPDTASQTDLSALSQGLEVHMDDAMSDERTSAMQLLQQIIDIQAASAENDGSISDPIPTHAQQQYTVEVKSQDPSHVGISETSAAINCLTMSENLNDIPGDVCQQAGQHLQTVDTSHYEASQHNSYEGSSEVISDAVLEQEVAEGVTVETEGHMTYTQPLTS